MGIKKFKNIIDFYLRKHLPFSRGFIREYSSSNQDKSTLFDDFVENIENTLIEEYSSFKNLKNNSSIDCYLENLYVLDILDRFIPKTGHKNVSVLDIGSKNWAYANALYCYFSSHYNLSKLDGVELDANRLYTDFYSRKDYANYFIKNFKNTNYIDNDLMNLSGSYDFITWFLPFVLKKPHQNWGLPDKFFKPEKMLEKALNLLNSDGILLIVNQGKCETDEQITLFEKLNIECGAKNQNYANLGEVTSPFLKFKNERFLFIVKK